jgi:threonine/homoserine/homoserine lactone efflux protein
VSITHWLSFAMASAVLLVIPGPTVLLVVSYALGHGRRFALATTGGVALGDLTSMTASMLGLGALLAASATGFTALKWAGALYLAYLGIKLWRTPVGDSQAPDTSMMHAGKVFAHAYAVTTLNPKSIVFFVAFVPQFIDMQAPLWPQMALFEATFVALAAINALGYALLAANARQAIRSGRVQRVVNRAGGAMLVGVGVLAATWRTASK